MLHSVDIVDRLLPIGAIHLEYRLSNGKAWCIFVHCMTLLNNDVFILNNFLCYLFRDFSHTSKLLITVWDKDLLSSDDFLGHVIVDVSKIKLDGSEAWFTLQPRHGRKEKVTGDICMSFVPGVKQNAPV